MLDNEVFYAAAGIGSAKTFRLNLAKRIYETFLNLHWLLQNGLQKKDSIEAEFRVCETLCANLAKLGVKEIGLAETAYRQLAKELGR
jgi:hypothetical protein